MKEDNSRKFKLPIRPVILDKESISGFLCRLSKKNYFTSISCFNKLLNLTIYQAQNNEFSEESVRKLGCLINKELEYYGLHNGLDLQVNIGSELYLKIIMKNKVKYCPLCITENYYHRTIWTITPFHLCIEHKVLLVDQCPHCYNFISMAAFMNRTCQSCSFKYVKWEPEVDKNQIFVESQNQIVKGFWDKEYCVINNYNFNQFFQLAYHSFYLLGGACDYTGMLEHHRLKLFYYRSDGEKSGLVFANAIANVYWMFSNFPDNFYTVLNDFLIRQSGQLRCDRLNSFEKVFDLQTFKWVQEAYSSFFIDQINNGTVKISLDKYVSLKYDLISKKETGFILGIKSADVMRLVEEGYLTPAKVANFSNHVFSIQEVNVLLESCIGKIILEKHHSLISFQDALSKYSVNSLTILDIIKYTLSGQLTPVCIGQNKKLADNYYEEKELELCLELIKLNQQNEYRYVFSDVMKLLKIGEKRLWRTLEDNNIKADFTLIMKDGWERYYFKEETIQRIRGCISKSTEKKASNTIEGIWRT
jgi:hypothetical protein